DVNDAGGTVTGFTDLDGVGRAVPGEVQRVLAEKAISPLEGTDELDFGIRLAGLDLTDVVDPEPIALGHGLDRVVIAAAVQGDGPVLGDVGEEEPVPVEAGAHAVDPVLGDKRGDQVRVRRVAGVDGRDDPRL